MILCLNDLYVANFISHQTVNHTYFKAGQRSYLDHILVPKSMHDDILSCTILSKEPDNVSDHYALSIRLKLSFQNVEKRLSEGMDNMISFPKTRWNDKEFVACYQESLKDILVEYMRTETAINRVLNEDDAQEYVDSLCDKLAHCVHNASEKAFKLKLKDRRRKRHWWGFDCKMARNRNRLWYKIWNDCGGPKQGLVSDCYKNAKKTFRRVCSLAISKVQHKQYSMIDALQKSRRTGEFWNTIKKIQNHKCDKQNVVEMDQFIQFYKAKFSKSKLKAMKPYLKLCLLSKKNITL